MAKTEPVLLAAARSLSDNAFAPPPSPFRQRLEDWLTPLRYPNKVICAGANYYDHVTKDGGHSDYNKEDNIPVFFLKPPTTTLVGQGKSVRYPAQSDKFDYELELAVVIGKRGRHIATDEARDYIAGYTIGLDLSARDWQRHPKHLANSTCSAAKPSTTVARSVRDRARPVRRRRQPGLEIPSEWRTQARRQHEGMIWPVPELVSRISDHVTLEPGDVVLTGTPAGVGLSTGVMDACRRPPAR